MIAPEPRQARIGGIEIAFIDVWPDPALASDPDPILLIHGFASTYGVNWIGPSWTTTLTRAGFRVVALDNRGHGRSTKLYDPADYDTAKMAGDALGLLDHLGIGRADVMGYSMGARISAFFALQAPDRTRSCLLGGLGSHLVDGVGLSPRIADAMEAASIEELTDPTQRMFRGFADRNGQDRRALAACIRGSRQTLAPEEVARIAKPVLVSIGTRDEIAGSAHELAALFPDGRALDIPGRDHGLAVGDRVHKEGVLAFLAERP